MLLQGDVLEPKFFFLLLLRLGKTYTNIVTLIIYWQVSILEFKNMNQSNIKRFGFSNFYVFTTNSSVIGKQLCLPDLNLQFVPER